MLWISIDFLLLSMDFLLISIDLHIISIGFSTPSMTATNPWNRFAPDDETIQHRETQNGFPRLLAAMQPNARIPYTKEPVTST